MLKSGFVLPRPILLVLTALGLLFAIDLFALAAYRELEQACGELNHRIQAAEALHTLPLMMLEMQSGMRGYILTGSTASLGRYRAAADRYPDAAQKALALREEYAGQGELTEAAAGSARNWLSGYASPLVVTRSAGDNRQRTMTAILKIMRKNQGESQVE